MASGRGRLSSLDLLPEAASEHVVWAYEQLRQRKLTQTEILDQFNLKLKLAGLGQQITSSSFSRASVRFARIARQMEQVREIGGALAKKFEDGSDETMTLLVSDMIKMIAFQALEQCDNPSADVETSEMLGNFSTALVNAERAKKVSADGRRVIEANFQKKATAAIDEVGKLRGLTGATVEEIKAKLLGVPKRGG